MGPVYRLTLRQLTGRWRLLITLILVSLPIVMVSVDAMIDDSSGEVRIEVSDPDQPERIDGRGDIKSIEEMEAEFDAMDAESQAARDEEEREEFQAGVIALLVGGIAPIVVLAIASVAFSNELEDRTLANLTLSPIPRWQIVLPKLLGAISVAAPFITISAIATSYIMFDGDVTATVAVAVGAFVGVALYASVFTWVGLMTTRAIGFGLLYVFLWEGLFAGLVSGVRFLSINHYSISLIHGLDDRRFAGDEVLSFTVVISTAVAVFAIFFLLAVRRLRRMDVP